jgi:spermidine synthase
VIITQAPVTGRIPLAATLAVGASACLAFAIEPFTGKVLLPHLGGSPSVWNSCVMVFQILLLAGYGYSVLLVRLADLRRAFALHSALVVASLALWPLAVRALWLTPRAGWPPAAWIVVTTVAGIGLPFTILSATSPLLQVWLARTSPSQLNVHRLYAASNVASVVGLVVYVAGLEPFVGVGRQSTVLWLGYAGAMILALGVARRASRSVTPAPLRADRVPEGLESFVSGRSRLAWIAISFGASLCLYAVTTYITTDVASFPLLWCLPLGVFLLGFAAGFSAWAARFRLWLIRAAKLAALAALAHLVWVEDSRTLWVGLLAPLLTLAFMVTALAAELAHRRPEEDRLAGFYVWVGLGGVIAGIASVIVLPWAWSSISLSGVPAGSTPIQVLRSLSPVLLTEAVPEYAAALLLSTWLLSKWKSDRDVWRLFLGVSAAVLIAVVGTRFLSGWSLNHRMALVGVAVACAFIASCQGTRLLAASLALAMVGGLVRTPENEVLFEARNFFGTSRVQRADDVYQLKHGTTLHGIQPIGPDADSPASYYSWASPLGRVMDHLRPHNVVAVGLGVGTVAAYGRAGDRYRFLEINPLVPKIATNPQWFSYVAAAQRRGVMVDIAVGDGRLLAETLDEGAWDLIVVDAFSSDAIPVHLLSLEAVRMFEHKLSARGVIAYHISNRFFDLYPVIAAAAARVGMSWALQTREGLTETDYGSTWVMLAKSDTSARDAGLTEIGWEQPAVPPTLEPWTDDWANVLGTMRSWRFWTRTDD